MKKIVLALSVLFTMLVFTQGNVLNSESGDAVAAPPGYVPIPGTRPANPHPEDWTTCGPAGCRQGICSKTAPSGNCRHPYMPEGMTACNPNYPSGCTPGAECFSGNGVICTCVGGNWACLVNQ